MPATVLIVDDSIPLHQLIRNHLAPEGFILHSSYDGESALAAAATLNPHVILLDVDMPALDGFEVCRRLKSNAATASIPLIFVTADAIVTDRVKGLDLGAIDYVIKPFKPEELRARIRATLRSRHQLEKKTMVDGLTGLWNRAYLDVSLGSHLSLSKRTGRPLSCIVADVDRLSTINQHHGEAMGGEILKAVGRILVGQVRAEDVVFRIEGGKFAIFLPGAARAAAAHLADRLRGEIERQLLQRRGIAVGVTCSFGVADTIVAGDTTLFERADAAAYRCKQIGRNCVSIAHPPESRINVA